MQCSRYSKLEVENRALRAKLNIYRQGDLDSLPSRIPDADYFIPMGGRFER